MKKNNLISKNKITSFILLLILILISCKNSKKELQKNEILKQNIIKIEKDVEEVEEERVKLILKDSIGIKLDNNKISLNENKWNNLRYDKIEEFNKDFDCSILGEFKIKGEKIILIERSYIEESIHWVIITNSDNKIVDFIKSAYENSEGFSTIKSEIFFEKIIIKEWNIYSENKYKEDIYLMTEKGFVKK